MRFKHEKQKINPHRQFVCADFCGQRPQEKYENNAILNLNSCTQSKIMKINNYKSIDKKWQICYYDW